MKKLLILALTFCSLNANAASLSQALQAKMDFLIARQNVVSSNIANASTPGYIAKDLVYKPSTSANQGSKLKMVGSNSKHLRASNGVSGYKIVEDKRFIRNDGNSVRMDQQMLNMAQIQQEYTLATRLFTKQMGLQKLAIQVK